MFKVLRRWWRYLASLFGAKLEEVADPKIQLEQAISESREQHRRLTEQAATIIANQKQLEMRLDRAIDDYEKARGSASQALLLADEASRTGDEGKAATFGQAAEAYASRLVTLERQVAELRAGLLVAAEQSAQAKQAVKLNAIAVQKALAERERLLSQIDQARMQEQMNAAMAQMRESVGDDVPTLEEVRTKVERRLAAANAASELTGATVDTKMLEVEQAQADAETHVRLAELRSQLGLGPGSGTPAVTVSKAEPTAIQPGDGTSS